MLKHILNILMDIIFIIPLAFIFLYFLTIKLPEYITYITNHIKSINKKIKGGKNVRETDF